MKNSFDKAEDCDKIEKSEVQDEKYPRII